MQPVETMLSVIEHPFSSPANRRSAFDGLNEWLDAFAESLIFNERLYPYWGA